MEPVLQPKQAQWTRTLIEEQRAEDVALMNEYEDLCVEEWQGLRIIFRLGHQRIIAFSVYKGCTLWGVSV